MRGFIARVFVCTSELVRGTWRGRMIRAMRTRMGSYSKLPVGFLDLKLRSRRRDAQGFVVGQISNHGR